MIWLLLKIIITLIFIYFVHQYFLKPNGFIQFYKKQGVANCVLAPLSKSAWNAQRRNLLLGNSKERVLLNNAGSQVTLTINCPFLRSQVFELHEEYDKSRKFKNTYYFLLGNENLLFKNGKKWEEERLTFSNCFRSQTLQESYGRARARIQERIALVVEKEKIEANTFCKTLAVHVFFELFFGSLPKEFTGEPDNLLNIVNSIHEMEESRLFQLFGRRYFVMFRSSRQFLKEITLFREYLIKLVEKKAFEEAGEQEPEKQDSTLLQKIMLNSDFQTNKELYTEELLNNFLMFSLFVIDVLGTQAASILTLLQQNQEEKKALLEEISSLKLESAENEYNSIITLPTLDNIINESLRLKSALPFALPRIALQNHTLGATDGLEISKDTLVECCLVSGNLDENVFPDAKAFNPKRWDSLEKTPEHYLPFGSGPRRCIARTFSKNLLKVLLFWTLKIEGIEIVNEAASVDAAWALKSGILKSSSTILKFKRR